MIMRPGNMVNDLTWDRIRWNEKIAFIPKEVHKNRKKDGKYKLTIKVLKMLKRRQKENIWNFPYVFWRLESGKPVKIAERWIQRKWDDIMVEAGIREKEKSEGEEPLRFYDLKHTRLSRLGASKAANVLLLKAISNHSSTQSLERYVKNDALIDPALALMEEVDENWAENGV